MNTDTHTETHITKLLKAKDISKSKEKSDSLQVTLQDIVQVSTLRLSEDFCRKLAGQRQQDDTFKTLKENKQTNKKLSFEEEKETK